MTTWLFSVVLVAVVGTTVLADPRLTFPERAREASTRIVSGWEAQEGQLPFQLSLRLVSPAGAVTACGASIISAEWGLTAAHCTAGRVTVVIRAGAVSLTKPELIFETTEYYNHPLYNEAFAGIVQPHDIGLIKFGLSIPFSARVQPVRIQNSADKNRNYDGETLIASGWGRTWTNGASPENLNWVYQRGIPNEQCRSTYGGSSIIVDSTICSIFYNVTSQSTCQGDSGGPLTVVDVDGKVTEVGVASFVSGQGCHVNLPAGFIRPGHYHDWFTQVSGVNFDWTIQLPESSESQESSEAASSESSESSAPESSESAASQSSESAECSESSESDESSESAASESSESSESAASQSSESSESSESAASQSSESSESAASQSSESSESAASQSSESTESAASQSSESSESAASKSSESSESAASKSSESDSSQSSESSESAASKSSESSESNSSSSSSASSSSSSSAASSEED